MFHPSAVLRSGGDDVNACGIDRAVSEDIRQFGDILFNAVERAGEQMAEIVREDLRGADPRLSAKTFHLAPDGRAVDRSAGLRDKNASRSYFLLRTISEQFFS